MSGKIIEFAFVRNKLVSGHFGEEDKQILHNIKDKILLSNSPFKDILLNGINNCEQSIQDNNLVLAAREIQLIHNFTFGNPAAWNSDYFYKIELLSYLEQTDNVKRIKKLISLLARLSDV